MLRPLRDRILVHPDAVAAHVSVAGLVIASREGIHTSQEQLGRTGTVVAIGSCRARYEDPFGNKANRFRSEPPSLKVGERVLFGEFEYPKIGDDLVMSEADIVGVIEAENAQNPS